MMTGQTMFSRRKMHSGFNDAPKKKPAKKKITSEQAFSVTNFR